MTARAKSSRLRDPHGGLTAAGRAWFHRKQGSHLKAGVKHKGMAMTAQDWRRKGSWAVRFYGRKGALPPLVDDEGKPTRFALTARAWGGYYGSYGGGYAPYATRAVGLYGSGYGRVARHGGWGRRCCY